MRSPLPEESPDAVDLAVLALLDQLKQLPAAARPAALAQRRNLAPTVRLRVEQLLTQIDSVATRDATQVAAAGAEVGLLSLRPVVRGYEILEVLGEGGMGTVYLAESRVPVRRRVALKVVKLGMDSKAVVARFEAERQALSMLEHSNIARVYECGATETGQPWFAMEYVAGVPIDAYCDQHRLSVAERIGLFKKVCAGVQHAHLKGIIHRDIKPSNVLVAEQDGTAVPKIIDFGLAKAMAHRLSDATLLTEHGALLGTPEYMSPEQAGLAGRDVDTRTDVYSLGILLYELLTGVVPFQRTSTDIAALLDLQRSIREVDVPRASAALAGLGDGVDEVAARRGMGPGELVAALRSDLDWILRRALDKDPEQRYQSAAELATDLGRHLRFEPVTARPPTWRYRIGRFLRRHRGRVLAATALVVLGGAGVAGVAWFASLAEEQATMVRARDEAVAHTQGLAREEAAEAGRQRSRAEQLADEVALRAAALERERGELQRLDQLARHEAERAKASADDATAARAELVRERAAVAGLQRDLETAQTELAAAHRRAEDAAAAAAFAESGRGWLQALAAAEQLPSAWSRRGKGVAADPDGTLAQAYARLQALREAPSADPLLASLRPVGAGVAARLGELLAFEALDADAAQDPAWDAAIDAIERADGVVASSDYRGMPRLQRQRGLVPIGCNPRTKLWEFYLPAAATGSALMRAAGVVPRPTIAARGALRLQGGQGVVFVLLPGGKRKLGAQSQAAKAAGYDPAARPEEGPVHEVELAPFFVATHELTRGQWERLGGRLPPRPEVAAGDRSQAELLPIVDVSWLEVQAVLGRHRLSLPTEAQWEYVCRSATETPWWTGRELATLDVAMHLSRLDTKLQRMLCNRCKLTRTVSQGPGDVRCLRCTQPMVEVVGDQRQGLALLTGVGQREPNLFGCFDVHGNAAEWCQDEFVSYRDSKPRPGDGMRSGAGTSSRVVRGGLVGPDDARSSSRAQAAEHLPCARVGVRLVLPLIGGGTATPQSSR